MLLYANWLSTNDVIAVPVTSLGSLQLLSMDCSCLRLRASPLTFLYTSPAFPQGPNQMRTQWVPQIPLLKAYTALYLSHITYFLPGHNLMCPKAAQDALHIVGAP